MGNLNNKREDHNASFDTNHLEIVSFTDDQGNVRYDGLEHEPVDDFGSSFVYFTDAEERRSNVVNDHPRYEYNHDDEEGEGVVIFKAPSKLSWPVLASVGVFVVNMIITASAFYHQQSTFNEKMTERIDVNNEKIKDLSETTYDKSQIDLKIENLKLELQRHVSDVVGNNRSNYRDNYSNYNYPQNNQNNSNP